MRRLPMCCRSRGRPDFYMDMEQRDAIESAHQEIEAILNGLIELFSSDSQSEDVAFLLIRVRNLMRAVRPDFLE